MNLNDIWIAVQVCQGCKTPQVGAPLSAQCPVCSTDALQPDRKSWERWKNTAWKALSAMPHGTLLVTDERPETDE